MQGFVDQMVPAVGQKHLGVGIEQACHVLDIAHVHSI